ncbi:uncharacterized protein FFNC_13988 [Fusarium fujikuroi]|nr:uncharacterized protein FFNC_13988 [Fusarium fujikuroi]
MLISASRHTNESESSRFGGPVETAGGSSERYLSAKELEAVLVDYARKRNTLIGEHDDVEMAGAQDEPFEFSTVTKIYPKESYHYGTSAVEDEDPNDPSDEQDHEHPKLPRVARRLNPHSRDVPPSVAGLPSRYTQWNQECIIDDYFRGFNQVTPLFSELDYEYFENHCREQCGTKNAWCVIYVMLVLSLRNEPENDYPGDDEKFIGSACAYVDRHLYILSNETGLKIVLGIALYFMTTWNLERAGFMHAIAIKLVYRLGFHKMVGESAKPVWIAYIIDRDLSLLTGESYLMQEHDIDPSVADLSDEDGGILHNLRDDCRFEIFKYRARLATIRGKIFDLQETVADRLDEMLEKWAELIPVPFRGDGDPIFNDVQLSYFKQLHVTYYHCIFSVRQATLRNQEWVDRLLRFGEVRKPADSDTPLLPSNWSGLFTAARKCLDMINKVDDDDLAFHWSCTHATQAAMTILAANNITLSEHDLHDSIDKDQQRLHIAHGEVSDRLDEERTGSIEKSFNTCGDLIIKTRESVRQFNESRSVGES